MCQNLEVTEDRQDDRMPPFWYIGSYLIIIQTHYTTNTFKLKLKLSRTINSYCRTFLLACMSILFGLSRGITSQIEILIRLWYFDTIQWKHLLLDYSKRGLGFLEISIWLLPLPCLSVNNTLCYLYYYQMTVKFYNWL